MLAGLGISVTLRWSLVSLWSTAWASTQWELGLVAGEGFLVYACLAGSFSLPEPTGWRKSLQKSLTRWLAKQVSDDPAPGSPIAI